ncbi:MAG TPA: hypothetical protein PLF98_08465 [Thermotogota bacterium]|mgnify:CR=1 FL=1|nr:hypothetical protein [Thermotogota bacterium]
MNWFKEKWLKREKEIEKKIAHIHARPIKIILTFKTNGCFNKRLREKNRKPSKKEG